MKPRRDREPENVSFQLLSPGGGGGNLRLLAYAKLGVEVFIYGWMVVFAWVAVPDP